MIISFAWTTKALLAGQKTVTRRQWKPSHARKFHPGMLVEAWDRSPRHGGRKVGWLRILSVTYEPDALAPDADYLAEGFSYYERHPGELPRGDRLAYLERCTWAAFDAWRRAGGSSWVIRFEVVPLKQEEES